MKPSQLVDHLLSEDNTVQRIVNRVEKYLGDVITPETDDATAREECWTLCIDTANSLIGQGPRAIAAAKEACAELGYPPKGYRQRKQKVQPVWPPRAASDPVPEEPAPKTTGIHHPAYRPNIPNFSR